jgi:hypothetical protein
VLTKGQKAGAAFKQSLGETFPEIADSFTNSTNIGEARELIRRLADSLPDDQKDKGDVDLPAGLDGKENGVFRMLPEPIYIQAVKDLTDGTKTKESTLACTRLYGYSARQPLPELWTRTAPVKGIPALSGA